MSTFKKKVTSFFNGKKSAQMRYDDLITDEQKQAFIAESLSKDLICAIQLLTLIYKEKELRDVLVPKLIQMIDESKKQQNA